MLGPALRQPLRSLRLPGATRAVCTHAFPRSESDSLLQVPGIGRRAQEKLASKDVDGVKKLCQLYLEEHARDKQALVRYLAVRDTVLRGGTQRAHAYERSASKARRRSRTPAAPAVAAPTPPRM